MKYSVLILFVFSLFFSVSCNSDIHRDGTVLYYTESGGKLYLIYKNNEQNHILTADLEPLSTKWEKSISGDKEAPELKIFDKYLACNCEENKVCLLSVENGKTVISFDSELIFNKNTKGFLVNEGKVYSLCNESEICAFDIEKNELLWNYKLGESENITADFKIQNGTVLFGNSSSIIKALSTGTGELKWESEPLPNLVDIYLFPETLLADYEFVNGLDLSTGNSKWIAPYEGRVRCILDGTVISQSNDYFSALYIENGVKLWEYPRNGTTILTCEEGLNLAAFTVKNYNDVPATDTEYFDKIYIFNVSSFEKVFETNSDREYTVLNLTGFNETNFYIAKKHLQETGNITVERYSSTTFELEKSFIFSVNKPKEEIYISWIHTDPSFTVIRRSSISDTTDETYYLFDNESGALLGEMTGIPEIMTSTKAYDIISYDNYFNVIEKTLDDFLK